jgi:hypothetical protein
VSSKPHSRTCDAAVIIKPTSVEQRMVAKRVIVGQALPWSTSPTQQPE